MPHDPGSPSSWMRFAYSDLAVAKQNQDPDVLLEILCFHAQQAAEKAIKAVLIHFGIPVQRTHSIERLIDLLPAAIPRTPLLIEAAMLTDYAVLFRYPSDEAPVTQDDHEDAIRIAENVVAWAETMINSESESE